QPGIDFAASQARKQKVVDQLWKGLQSLMKGRKITIVKGTGTLGPHRIVKVDDGTELEGTSGVILASGSAARPLPGFAIGGPIMTSDELLDLDRLPSSAAVIGGGARRGQLASMHSYLGAPATML